MSDEVKEGGPLRFLLELLVTVAIAVGVAILLRAFVFGVYTVPTGSMLDTIHQGDMLIGEKVTLHWQSPQVGDIVTFEDPRDSSTTLIKRVVAVGGQTIDLRDGKLYVDGVEENEPYTGGKETVSLSDYAGSAGITYPYTVPDGYIFCMGDNRTNSLDSRYFGPVSVDAVSSKGLFIYWPLSDAQLL